MRIHGVAINVPRTSSDRPDRTSRLWQALADANELSGLSPASLSPVLNFAYRLYGWVGHPPSNRFGQVNLRPEVFDLRRQCHSAGDLATMASRPLPGR